MLSNSEIKFLRSMREKKFRDREGMFVVEGEKMVSEALESDFEVLGVWRREEIGDEAMERISSLSTASPALALLKQKARTGFPAKPGKGLWLALDSVRDPGNLGTIMRIADWFGVNGVFLSEDSAEMYNPKVVQATMGAIFRKRFSYGPLAELCNTFKNNGMEVWGTVLNGENIYTEELTPDGLLVMGNESRGISPEISALLTRRLTIPRFGDSGAESLNVAVACAVATAEFRRRSL